MDQELPKLSRKLRILAVSPNMGGCSFYRLLDPMKKLAKALPDHVEVKFNANPLSWEKRKDGGYVPNQDLGKMPDIDWADIVFTCNIHEIGAPYNHALLSVAKKKGKFFHFDTDDLLTDLYEGHRHYENYKNLQLDELTKMLYANSNLVTVTQRKFAERIQPYIVNGAMAIVKNAIDYDLPCWNLPKLPSKQVRVGWVGGIHHEEDVKEFTGVMLAVNAKVGPENVKWNFFGRPFMPPGQKRDWQQDVWDNYQKILMRGSKRSNVEIFFAQPCEQYGKFYQHIDIAIAPLQMNAFNDSKSSIKVAECGRYGVPLICSDVGAYDEDIINGKTGFLIPKENLVSVWTDKLVRTIKDKKLREDMGKTLKQKTDECYDLNKQVHNRYLLYLEVMNKIGYTIK